MIATAAPQNLVQSVKFDRKLIRRLRQLGPRYTSYPTADRFSMEFDFGDYLKKVVALRAMGGRQPVSLYIHIPFCNTICYYCACNKVVTKDNAKSEVYLDYLKREIALQGDLFVGMNQVEQIHFGGGTPTYLSDAQMDDLLACMRQKFRFAPDEVGEYAIEVDPRTVTADRVHKLRAQGFNRISLGVQDFDPIVQKAVNRVQPQEQTLAIIDAARAAKFRSVSIDLIYGLPKQNIITMSQTLAKVIDASPDRIAIYNYAHMPHLFKPQRRIAQDDLPNAETKLDMLFLCIKRLTDAGYLYIGMDHFAKPTDELVIAQKQGRLHRNFQGYSTHADAVLVSCGVSAISAVGTSYSQNEKTLEAYYERLDNNELPVARGIKLSMDDLIRRAIIQTLMCHFELSISSIELAYPITFNEYFVTELKTLRVLEEDGLVKIEEKWLCVTLKGRLLIRNICMVFDRYLRDKQEPMLHSSTI